MVTYGRPRLVVYTNLLTAHRCYRPDLASNQIQTDSQKFGRRVFLIVMFCFFPRQRRNAHLTCRGSNMAHGEGGGSRHDSARLLLSSANKLLAAMLAFPVPRRSLSCDS
jgi:hypothetical protein